MPDTPHPATVARRARVQRIRQSVLAAAVAVFVAAFSTIYVQMASGQDPALSKSASKSTSSAPASPASANATPTPTPTPTVAPQQDTQAPAPMTTRQS